MSPMTVIQSEFCNSVCRVAQEKLGWYDVRMINNVICFAV